MNNLIRLISFSHCSALNCHLFSHVITELFLPPPVYCKYFLKIQLQLVKMFTKIQHSLFLFATLNIKSFLPSFGLFSIDLPMLLVS